jgi:signal peptidase II
MELMDGSIQIIENYLHLAYVENHALAFGMLDFIDINLRLPIILILTGTIIVFAFVYLWRIRKNNITALIALAILLSGALGNWTDRFIHGFVTDFIFVHYYDAGFPVFNLADILINIGIILIILQPKVWKSSF